MYQDVQGAFSDMTEVVRERFAGIRIIKAYNREKAEAAKLEEFSEQSLQRLSLAVTTYGFMKAMELTPERDPHALKRQIESVMKECPEVYELYEALKKQIKPRLDVLFSN